MQTIAAVSPNAARLINIGTPNYIQNAPFTASVTQTGVAVNEQLFNVGPCLITFAEQGVNINPLLIQISPRIFQIDAIGGQIQPELLTIDPTSSISAPTVRCSCSAAQTLCSVLHLLALTACTACPKWSGQDAWPVASVLNVEAVVSAVLA